MRFGGFCVRRGCCSDAGVGGMRARSREDFIRDWNGFPAAHRCARAKPRECESQSLQAGGAVWSDRGGLCGVSEVNVGQYFRK